MDYVKTVGKCFREDLTVDFNNHKIDNRNTCAEEGEQNNGYKW